MAAWRAAGLSFWLIENPAANVPQSPSPAGSGLCVRVRRVALCVPLGIATRNAHSVSVASADVIRGGLVFDAPGSRGSVVLMGDGDAAMYAPVVKQICAELGCKLSVICVAGGDPLPPLRDDEGRLWPDSLAVVAREKPDCLLLACRWEAKLQAGRQRLDLALRAVEPHVGRVALLNQPPLLPAAATREAMRQGARPPFQEGPESRRCRLQANDFLQQCVSQRCTVVDIASHFQRGRGRFCFSTPRADKLVQTKRTCPASRRRWSAIVSSKPLARRSITPHNSPPRPLWPGRTPARNLRSPPGPAPKKAPGPLPRQLGTDRQIMRPPRAAGLPLFQRWPTTDRRHPPVASAWRTNSPALPGPTSSR